MRILLIAAASLLLLSGCFNSTEESDYQEVLSSLSVRKAGLFLEKYPDSKFGNVIVREFSFRCEAGPNRKECFDMLLGVIPRSHNQHKVVAAQIDSMK